MAEMVRVLPHGRELPGYQVASAGEHRPEKGPEPPSHANCSHIDDALAPREKAFPPSTEVLLTGPGDSRTRGRVLSFAFSQDEAKRVMDRIRAALPKCAHYNLWWADLYTRHGLKASQSPYNAGDEAISYQRLDPPAEDEDVGGSPVTFDPGPLQEDGPTITFIRTAGVITQYRDPLPESVARAFDRRFRRAGS
ncbi:hypothetical protein [Streptomyces sp. cmx-4-9]|uniref:hypothetical protein n=1 Tax=Streptomyces sp. cmx-4-9 TaxID=2790941 RepID=UPI00397FF3FA